MVSNINCKLIIGLVAYGENTAKYLPYFLESLRAQTFRDFRILAQDNTEKPDNFNKFAFDEAYKEVEYEWSGGNIGFAKAYNRLIKKAVSQGAEYFLVANPDTILEIDFLARLVEAIEGDQELGSVAPKIFHWDFPAKRKTDIIDTCGIKETAPLRFIDIGQGEKDQGQFDDAAILGPSGAASLFRLRALEQVKEGENYFDENMFMYFEDCDLAYRLRLAGFKSKLVPAARLYHDRTAKAGGEGSLSIALNRRNKSRQVKTWSFLNKHIIFYKYFGLLGWPERLGVISYALKMLVFVLLFEPYLLKQYLVLWKIRGNIRKYFKN